MTHSMLSDCRCIRGKHTSTQRMSCYNGQAHRAPVFSRSIGLEAHSTIFMLHVDEATSPPSSVTEPDLARQYPRYNLNSVADDGLANWSYSSLLCTRSPPSRLRRRYHWDADVVLQHTRGASMQHDISPPWATTAAHV